MMDAVYDIGITMLGLSLVLFVYTLPAFVAYMRHHKHFGRILALNVFTGVLVLPWFATLAWAALTSSKEQQ